MSDRELIAYLDGRLIGRFTQSSSGNLAFEYDVEYRAMPGATPLSSSMPLATATHKKRSVLPWLEGLLPDSAEALSAIGKRFHISAGKPFAVLEKIGADAAGAVQLLPPGAPPSDANTRGSVRSVSDDDVVSLLAGAVREYSEGIPESSAPGRFSLAGAQPKIALHRLPDGTWGVSDDATPTTHILKPVIGGFRRIDVVEQLTLRAAAELGNRVAGSQITRIGDWDVLVSERYDRRLVGSTWHRLHQEDMCQALSVSPKRKYQHRDGGPGVSAIAGLIDSFPLSADRVEVGAAFFRAFAFTVIAGCTDAHAKNYSLMLDGRTVTLAPLYDLLTHAGYWDGTARIESAMSVNGQYAFNRISAADLVRVGMRFGLSLSDAEDVVHTIRRGMLPAFEAARVSFEGHDAGAGSMADEVLAGVRKLPLVVS